MNWVEEAMGRKERLVEAPPGELGRVLVTGAKGSVGARLLQSLHTGGYKGVVATDVFELDVTNESAVKRAMKMWEPEVVFHLAGAKHAPDGEADPLGVTLVNTVGTANILEHAPAQSRVVMASTCKACNPETAYGASKLIAERMTLNAGHSVVRYYNIVESSANVFEAWQRVSKKEPIPWTPCTRYFISMPEAVALTVWAALSPAGRYTIDPGISRRMRAVAGAIYPDRKLIETLPRRGDRVEEPLCAMHETITPAGNIWRVESPHDGKEDE